MVYFIFEDDCCFVVDHFKTLHQCRFDSCSTKFQPLADTQDNISYAWNIKLEYESGSWEERKESAFS